MHYHVAFRGGPHRDTVIELHWSLISGDGDWRAPDIDWFWHQTEPWHSPEASASREASQLTPTAQLLYLSAHAMLQHGSAATRLLWLYDIHRVVERDGARLSWPEIVERARALEWDTAVAEALERCASLFGTALPDFVLPELRRAVTARTARHVASKANRETSRAELVWRELLCLDAAARARLMLAILFPRPAYLKWRYPRARWLWPLAYAYRWAVVAWEGTTSVLRHALPRKRPSAC